MSFIAASVLVIAGFIVGYFQGYRRIRYPDVPQSANYLAHKKKIKNIGYLWVLVGSLWFLAGILLIMEPSDPYLWLYAGIATIMAGVNRFITESTYRKIGEQYRFPKREIE